MLSRFQSTGGNLICSSVYLGPNINTTLDPFTAGSIFKQVVGANFPLLSIAAIHERGEKLLLSIGSPPNGISGLQCMGLVTVGAS